MRVNESGRSMIEMLGVLAISGVLSFGGIAGYSKAMNKFKTNKVADQVSMIVANVKTLYAQQNTYDELKNTNAISMGVIPDELGTDTTNGILTNAFNGGVFVYQSDSTTTGDKKAFIIEFDNLSREACITLATNDWGSGYSSGLIAIQAQGTSVASDGNKKDATGVNKLGTVMIGDTGTAATGPAEGKAEGGSAIATPGGSKLSVPMKVTDAAKACGCTKGNNCSVAWKYY